MVTSRTGEVLNTNNPYLGPRPFTLTDAYRFFGRENEISDLYSLVVAHRTVLLYAPSGAGKTSLLNAGLIPMLQKAGFDVLPTARISGVSSKDNVNSEKENMYIYAVSRTWVSEGGNAHANLLEILANRYREADGHGEFKPRVVVIDQFEEFFSFYPERWQERKGFFEQVEQAMSAEPTLRLLIGMREDFVAHMDPYTELVPEEFRTRYRLEALRREDALSAAEKPLEGTGFQFQSGVANLLVNDLLKIPARSADQVATNISTVSDDPNTPDPRLGEFVEPVQLQVVCYRLFRHVLRQGSSEITAQDLRDFGDVEQALRQFYEEALEETERRTGVKTDDLRDWFDTKLITESGSRGLVIRGDKTTGGISNAAVEILDELHVIRPEVRGHDRWYELSHDRFVRPIMRANQARFQQRKTESAELKLSSLEGVPPSVIADWERDFPGLTEFWVYLPEFLGGGDKPIATEIVDVMAHNISIKDTAYIYIVESHKNIAKLLELVNKLQAHPLCAQVHPATNVRVLVLSGSAPNGVADAVTEAVTRLLHLGNCWIANPTSVNPDGYEVAEKPGSKLPDGRRLPATKMKRIIDNLTEIMKEFPPPNFEGITETNVDSLLEYSPLIQVERRVSQKSPKPAHFS